MKMKKTVLFCLVLVIVVCNLFASIAFADSTPSISLEFDKTNAKVGDVVKASLKVNNIQNFDGFQVCMRYNPEVLQAINPDTGEAYNETTVPTGGDILQKQEYGAFPVASNIPESGVLNFGKSYLNLAAYQKSAKPETTGTVAVIGFKVLEDAAAEIIFEDLGTLPGSVQGTVLFDWDAKIIKDYTVNLPSKINPNSKPAPLAKFTQKPRQITPPPNSGNNNPPADNSGNTQSKSSTSTVLIVVGVVLVIIIIVVLIMTISKKGTGNSNGGDKVYDNDDNDEDEDKE